MFYDQETSDKYATQRTASSSLLHRSLTLNVRYGARVNLEQEDGLTPTRNNCINWYCDQDCHQYDGTEQGKSKNFFATISNFINIYFKCVLFKLCAHSYIFSLSSRVKHQSYCQKCHRHVC